MNDSKTIQAVRDRLAHAQQVWPDSWEWRKFTTTGHELSLLLARIEQLEAANARYNRAMWRMQYGTADDRPVPDGSGA